MNDHIALDHAQKTIALLIDGGYLRALARQAGHLYTPEFIDNFAHNCKEENEELHRVLYYDCRPYQGIQLKPISGNPQTFDRNSGWLDDLASRNLFAVRLGILKFRGWKPKRIPTKGKELTDEDFAPDFEQKGVDMRIGLDIATLATTRAIDRVILVSADSDFIPAMKLARRAGLQVVAIRPPNGRLTREFLAHVDIDRPIGWPAAV